MRLKFSVHLLRVPFPMSLHPHILPYWRLYPPYACWVRKVTFNFTQPFLISTRILPVFFENLKINKCALKGNKLNKNYRAKHILAGIAKVYRRTCFRWKNMSSVWAWPHHENFTIILMSYLFIQEQKVLVSFIWCQRQGKKMQKHIIKFNF